MGEMLDERRKYLEEKLKEAALNLAAHMDAPAIRLTMLPRDPAIFIMIGTAEDIKALLPKE